jgi:hypothetical protein
LRVAATIAWRTRPVTAGAIAEIDTDIAAAATGWGVLSDAHLDIKIDAAIETYAPDANLHYRDAARECDVPPSCSTAP